MCWPKFTCFLFVWTSLLQPSRFVGLLCSLLPQPNEDGQVQGAPVDDGRLPQVNHHDDGVKLVKEEDWRKPGWTPSQNDKTSKTMITIELFRIVITPLSYVTFADFWVAGWFLFISTPVAEVKILNQAMIYISNQGKANLHCPVNSPYKFSI